MKTLKHTLMVAAIVACTILVSAPHWVEAQLNRVSINQILGGAAGQVLATTSTGSAPAYTAAPSVTSVTVKAGTSTATLKTGGILCQNLANITDASVQNQWNAASCAIPANTLAVNGDTLDLEFAWTAAANANTKGYQTYFALGSATCSGSSGNLCNSGCQPGGAATTAANGTIFMHHIFITRTSAGNQKFYGLVSNAGSTVAALNGTCTIDETAATQIAVGVMNSSAAAASIASSLQNIFYFGK